MIARLRLAIMVVPTLATLQPSFHFNVYDGENILLNRRGASHRHMRPMGGIING
jgi:hypothetical protein